MIQEDAVSQFRGAFSLRTTSYPQIKQSVSRLEPFIFTLCTEKRYFEQSLLSTKSNLFCLFPLLIREPPAGPVGAASNACVRKEGWKQRKKQKETIVLRYTQHKRSIADQATTMSVC